MKKWVIIGIVGLVIILGILGYIYLKGDKFVVEDEEWFQTGNTQKITGFQTKQSQELEDNRIGMMWGRDTWGQNIHTEQDVNNLVDEVNDMGLKWIRTSFDWFDWVEVEDTKEYSEYYIDPNYDEAITGFVNKDVKIMYILLYWDEEFQVDGVYYNSRFKTEDEIQGYLNYTKFIVNHFKDRIEYYEILNEPESIGVTDYINLVKRTVPIIRQDDPRAKIVVGAVSDLSNSFPRDFFFDLLKSDVMPLIDGVSWHGIYGTSPEHSRAYWYNQTPYYYAYPSLIQEIKDTASTHGFTGEYFAEEMVWRTPEGPHPDPWIYSDTVAAKYYSRAIIMHLSMDIIAGTILDSELLLSKIAVKNLATIMAGTEPINLLIEIESQATNIEHYTFSLTNGDKLIALWTDGIAIDDDLGVNANLTFASYNGKDVVAIDVLKGYTQLLTIEENTIENLIVRDYPLILKIS